MKINCNQIIFYAFISCASYNNAYFNHDDFEQEFTEKIERMHQDIQNLFKNFNQTDFITHTINSNNASCDNTNMQQKNNFSWFQEHASSLSFANKEKSITLQSKITQANSNYVITVINKNNNVDQDIQALDGLQNLLDYMQTNFRSQEACTILQTCIDALENQDQYNNASIATLEQDNKVQYTIEIKNEEPLEKIAMPSKKIESSKNLQHAKKKKSHTYTPRSKHHKNM